MALKRASVVAAPATKSSKNDMPIHIVVGTAVSSFNLKSAQIATLEADLARLKKELEDAGRDKLTRINVANATNPVSSVRLVDSNGSDATYIFQDKYSAADGDQADALFESMGKDINDFAQETAKAAFDSKVFLGADGNFDPNRYNKFKAAVDAVAAELNVASPLTSKLVVQPKPGFHAKRWATFTLEQQAKVSLALPNTNYVKVGKLAVAAPDSDTVSSCEEV